MKLVAREWEVIREQFAYFLFLFAHSELTSSSIHSNVRGTRRNTTRAELLSNTSSRSWSNSGTGFGRSNDIIRGDARNDSGVSLAGSTYVSLICW